ncbi:hypothetical protein [Allorhizocola rhizosphaerae]|uniref:hypothetical protein n=1 Tax=Allorhizocola rhizosphaerae TaxID=1872709 RepID=UPI0013C35BC9|nr:hypothetical protein [Allorhizocola rhizosphaerae]
MSLLAGGCAARDCASAPTPSGSQDTQNTQSTPPTGSGRTDRKYRLLDLPEGDSTVAEDAARWYEALRKGECASVQAALDRSWSRLDNPREVLIFQIAVELCRNNVDAAGRWFDLATNRYGWKGLFTDMHMCELYKAAASGIRQRSKDDFPCKHAYYEGEMPKWGDPKQDPRGARAGGTSPSPPGSARPSNSTPSPR